MGLIHIGPESQGPHYLESGKRPALRSKTALCGTVALQTSDGVVGAAQYYPQDDSFYWEFNMELCESPVCWWHLPAAVPMTEREWFEEQFTSEPSHNGQEDGENDWEGMGYQILFEPDFFYEEIDYTVSRLTDDGVDVLEYSCSLTDAFDTAYKHWVEAWRP